MQVRDHIRLEGRVQSREYEKILQGDDGDVVQKRDAYEVSCFSLEIVEEKSNQEDGKKGGVEV